MCEGVALAAACLEAGLAGVDPAVVRRLVGFMAAPVRAWLDSGAAAGATAGAASVLSDSIVFTPGHSSVFSMLTDQPECAEGITARLRIAVLAALARAVSLASSPSSSSADVLPGLVAGALHASGVDVARDLVPRWIDVLADFAAAAAGGGPKAAHASRSSLTAVAARSQVSHTSHPSPTVLTMQFQLT